MSNYYEILKNVCILAHEEKPSSFSDNKSPYAEIKKYINDILEEVCAKFYWSFRERLYSFNTTSGQKEYEFPSGMISSDILRDGIRIENSSKPLYFMFHHELDSIVSGSGKSYRYSVYSDKLILDPLPDGIYSVSVKYLTSNYAYNFDKSVEKPKLELETDISILPERFVKIIEWGAYSLYRQNFKPDNKYKLARDKYLEFLFDMQKNDNCCGDSYPSIEINKGLNSNQRTLKDFFKL